MASSPIPAPPAKKKKNLPFKRTVARKKSPDPFGDHPRPGSGEGGAGRDDDDDGIDLFRRSREVFPLAIEEQQRRLRRQESRKGREAAEKKDSDEQSSKRRRISTNLDSDGDDDGDGGEYFADAGSRRSSKRFGSPAVLFGVTQLIRITLLDPRQPSRPLDLPTDMSSHLWCPLDKVLGLRRT